MDFSKMEAQELLKQQVRVVREEVIETSHGMSCARTNKFAKQILRSLSVWSILQMEKLTDWYGIHLNAFEALGQLPRYVQQSRMVVATMLGVMLMISMVWFMAPGGSDQFEPEPEQQDEENQLEPGAEPSSLRYPASTNSLGMKYPGIFSDPGYFAMKEC